MRTVKLSLSPAPERPGIIARMTSEQLHCDRIPVAHTPPGGYGSEMPPQVLAGCQEPLVEGAPDLRGLWRMRRSFWRGEGRLPVEQSDLVVAA